VTVGTQRVALAVLALIAAALIIWLAMPVGVGILIGTLTAFALEPLQQRLAARWRRPELAALACVAATTVLFTIALGGLGYLLVTRGVVLARAAQEGFAPGGQARESAERLAKARTSHRTLKERMDLYTQSLVDHGAETTEADISWLDSLIALERKGGTSS